MSLPTTSTNKNNNNGYWNKQKTNKKQNRERLEVIVMREV